MLIPRLLTAVVLIPLLIWSILYGSTWLVVFWLTLALILTQAELLPMLLKHKLQNIEFDQSKDKRTLDRQVFYCTTSTILLNILVYLAYTIVSAHLALQSLIVSIMFQMILIVSVMKSNEKAFSAFSSCALGWVYGFLPWLSVWMIYKKSESPIFLVFLLVVVWSSDTGGYFGGRFFGKTKLAPTISPKKTREGAIAALLASILGGVGVVYYFGHGILSLEWAAMTAFLGCIATQLGDLTESLIKRVVGVKDSGSILPGHGGFLDRVDGLLFAAPMVSIMLQLYDYFK